LIDSQQYGTWVLGQFDCARLTHWKTGGLGRIFASMDALEKCMQTLRVLIASEDNNGMELAERAVNEYLATFPEAQHAGAVHMLQDAITPVWERSKGAQIEFINMVLDYIDRHNAGEQSSNIPDYG
jgi:hypothetical protein